MNRRDFLKGFGAITAALPLIGLRSAGRPEVATSTPKSMASPARKEKIPETLVEWCNRPFGVLRDRIAPSQRLINLECPEKNLIVLGYTVVAKNISSCWVWTPEGCVEASTFA